MPDIAKFNGVAVSGLSKINGRTMVAGDKILGLTWPGGGGGVSIIESIQQVEITIATSASTKAETITEVIVANTVVFIDYAPMSGGRNTSTNNSVNPNGIYSALNSSTSVSISRGAASNFTVTAVVTVVEFKAAAIDSIQYGSTFGTGSADTATISSVVTARSAIISAGVGYFTSNENYGDVMCSLELTNSTTVTVRRDISVEFTFPNFWVVEFASGITDSVQEFEVAITGDTDTSNTATITSVDTSRTMIFPGGQRADNATIELDRDSGYLELTNGTTATLTRNTGNAADIAIVGTAVQFDSTHIASIQRDTVTMASGDTTKDVTVSFVTTSLSLLNALSSTSTSSSAFTMHQQGFSSEIVDSTTIRFTKGATGRDVIISWELVEFE